MTDFYPSHGDERCADCRADIDLWYCLRPDGDTYPAGDSFDVLCPACFLLAEEVSA